MAIPTDGMIARYKIDSITANDGDSIALWEDVGGNGYDLPQSTPSKQPKYRSSGMGGLPSLEFDGVDDEFKLDFGSTWSQPNTVVIVGQILGSVTDSRPFVDGFGASNRHWVGFANGGLSTWAGSSFTSIVPIANKPTCTIARFDGGGSRRTYNGAITGNQSPGTHGFRPLTVGNRQQDGAYLHMYLTDIILYDRVLTQQEEDDIGFALMAERNITDFRFGLIATGVSSWAYGERADTGILYAAPFNEDTVLRVDPKTLEVTQISGGDVGLSPSWIGLIKANNGKLYGSPDSTSDILEIDPNDPDNETLARLPGGAGNGYYGGALAGNGKIYFCPRTGDRILIFDPVDDSTYPIWLTGDNAPPARPGSDWWGWFTSGDNGKLYGAPRGAGSVLVVDTSDDSVSYITANVPQAGRQYTGGILAGTGEIWFVPRNATTFLVVDTSNDTARTVGTLPDGEDKWNGARLGEDGFVYMFGRRQRTVVKIDPTDDSFTIKDMTQMNASAPNENMYVGAIAYPGGAILVAFDNDRNGLYWEEGMTDQSPWEFMSASIAIPSPVIDTVTANSIKWVW